MIRLSTLVRLRSEWGRTARTFLVAAAAVLAAVAWLVPLWRVRAAVARLSDAAPDWAVPYPFPVLPPPEREYAGVWSVPPETARRRLIEEYGFSQQIRAYLHAYERGDETVYEAASCVYRPNGFTGQWQLHVRLFGTPDGETDVWCHWERNANVAPLAHLRQEGYDAAEGIRRFRELVSDPIRMSGPVADRVQSTGRSKRTAARADGCPDETESASG